MIYVGIDVAKDTHYAAAMNSDGVVLIEPFPFGNNADGFSSLIKRISCCLRASKSDFFI